MVRTFVRIAVAFALACLSLSAGAHELSVLALVGPWPVADQLIAYRGRIWFSTSVKGIDHNSADLWSLDPATGAVRYERFLFSQDAGHPVVHDGLLYWPHEDMRIDLGTGVVSATDGENWRELFVPVGDHMIHTHAAAEWRGELVVAMAGWNAAMAASGDADASWRVLANDPPTIGSFHRYNDLAVLGDRLFVRHWSRDGPARKEFRGGRLVSIPGWPQNRFSSKFTRHLRHSLCDRRSRRRHNRAVAHRQWIRATGRICLAADRHAASGQRRRGFVDRRPGRRERPALKKHRRKAVRRGRHLSWRHRLQRRCTVTRRDLHLG